MMLWPANTFHLRYQYFMGRRNFSYVVLGDADLSSSNLKGID